MDMTWNKGNGICLGGYISDVQMDLSVHTFTVRTTTTFGWDADLYSWSGYRTTKVVKEYATPSWNEAMRYYRAIMDTMESQFVAEQ